MQQENEQWIILRVERGSEFYFSLQSLVALAHAQCALGLLSCKSATSKELALRLFKTAQAADVQAELAMHCINFDNTNQTN